MNKIDFISMNMKLKNDKYLHNNSRKILLCDTTANFTAMVSKIYMYISYGYAFWVWFLLCI